MAIYLTCFELTIYLPSLVSPFMYSPWANFPPFSENGLCYNDPVYGWSLAVDGYFSCYHSLVLFLYLGLHRTHIIHTRPFVDIIHCCVICLLLGPAATLARTWKRREIALEDSRCNISSRSSRCSQLFCCLECRNDFLMENLQGRDLDIEKYYI